MTEEPEPPKKLKQMSGPELVEMMRAIDPEITEELLRELEEFGLDLEEEDLV